MAIPTKGMKEDAQRALDWRKEFGRGGTRVGLARANQIVNGDNLSDSTIKRMYSFFSRHEVDKEAQGFRPGEKGFPSNGRIAWGLWGGDAGFSWSKKLVNQMKKENERQTSFDSINESEKHPLLTNEEEKSMNKEDRHILNVTETDNTVVVEFQKHEDVEHEDEFVDSEESSRQEKNELDIDVAINYRTIDLSQHSYLDEEKRLVRIGVSSEEPVERSFGLEVLSHEQKDIDMEFISSGRAPFLLDHDMTKQIGVIEEFKLDETAKRTIAVVRFGRSALAQEVFQDIQDGIRMNISVGYRVNKLERDNNGEEDYYRAAWSPMEVSSVSVPADQSRLVGVGRSANLNKGIIMTEEKKQDINLDQVRSQTLEEAKAEFKRIQTKSLI